MPSLRLFFLVALVATIVLAIPAPTRKRGLQKRSFKVPRLLNKAHPTGQQDGPAALRKVFRKYNFQLKTVFTSKEGFISLEKLNKNVTTAAAAAPNNQSGTVAANPSNNAALFLSPVDVGGQTLNLDFDTGSSDLWVFSTELDAQSIGNHTIYDPSKSATFKQVQGSQWKISYGDGSGALGIVGTDTVSIGGVKVENQTVELATAVSQSFIEDTNTDGLVGLAFSRLNTVNNGVKKTPQNTFFDNVMGDLDMPVFTADLDPDGTGVYEFGKIDSTKFVGQMVWTPVKAETGFWQFPSTKFAVGNQTFSNAAGSDAIADTGTSLLLVDEAVAETYYSQVQGAQLSQKAGGFIFPCGAALPDISVAIGDNMATIPGNQLSFANVDKANTTCFGAVQSNQGSGLQVFGDTLFKAQFVAFNGGNQSLGVGQKPVVQQFIMVPANLGPVDVEGTCARDDASVFGRKAQPVSIRHFFHTTLRDFESLITCFNIDSSCASADRGMELEVEEDELSPLEYARHHGLCKAYESEKLDLANVHSLADDTFDQDLWGLSDESVTNALRGLTKERLAVNKDAVLLLKAIHELRDGPQNLLTADGRKGKLGLKLELPLLRTDDELDLLSFGNATVPDLRNLNIPSEILRDEKDEGFEWPAKYFAYPTQCDELVKGEKLAVSREVLVHLQDALRDPYNPEDYEMIMVQSYGYKPSTALQPVTPPLLPLSPPVTPYIPPSPANRLPLASDSSDSVIAEAKALEQLIMNADSLTRMGSDSSESMLLDITHPPNLSPLFEQRTDPSLKRKGEDLKVEGPLTPPIFSTSPLKKLKSVSFTDMLHEYIPDAPWARALGDDDDEHSSSSSDVFERDIEPLAKQARWRVENEQLIGADTLSRPNIPAVDFLPSVAPWNEYSRRRGGKHRPGDTEIDAQIKFLLRVKREDLKSATSWHGLSVPERELGWNFFTTKITKIHLEESLHGETDLKKILTELTTSEIATSLGQVWKRAGLRMLDEEEEEQEIVPAETEERRDMEALIRKRRLELEDEIVETQRKRPTPEMSKEVLGSHHWEKELPVSHVDSKSRSKPNQDQQLEASIARHKSVSATKEAVNELMFGGFSATSALHKFMETQGKATKPANSRPSDTGQAKSQGQSPVRILPVRSREPSSEHSVSASQPVVPQTKARDIARPHLAQLPNVPANLTPCSFILSSTFLQKRAMMKQIEQLYSAAEVVYRDYDRPQSSTKEADIILSPSTGLIYTTLQQIKQRPLPGQPDRSPAKERMLALQMRYERLVVLISEGLSAEMETYGSSRPDDARDKEALAEYTNFAQQLEGEVNVQHVRGGEKALAHAIVIEMGKYGLPHGSCDIGDVKPLAIETSWELFLRRLGLNPFAAQVIMALLKKPYDVPLSLSSSSPASSGPLPIVSVFGLSAFVVMGEEERVKFFQAQMGGSRILKRISRVLDQQWMSAAHGFRL